MQDRTIDTLYAHWNEARGRAVAARRNHINPARMGAALPSIFMLEDTVHGPQFRLAGTLVCELFGRELRGKPFSGIWNPQSAENALESAKEAISRPCPILVSASAGADDASNEPARMILLPVSNDDDKVDRLIGALVVMGQHARLSRRRGFFLKIESFGAPMNWHGPAMSTAKPDAAVPSGA